MENAIGKIQDIFNDNRKDRILSLECGRYWGNLTISEKVVVGNDSENLDMKPILTGSVSIETSEVSINSVEFLQSVVIFESCHKVEFKNCRFSGPIRIGRSCEEILFKDCCMNTNGVGISMILPIRVSLTGCSFKGCLVGVSIQEDIRVSDSFESLSIGQLCTPYCTIKDCDFENSTDIVVRVSCLPNSVQTGPSLHTLWAGRLLALENNTGIVDWDVSVCGKFDVLSWKEWPLPNDIDIVCKRRGSHKSGRNCYIKTVGDCIHIWEDPPVADDSRALPTKKPKNTRHTRSEIHYSTILGIEPGSSLAEISSAFKKLALVHHPDKKESTCDNDFIQIKHARDELIKITQKT